jgi:hypothetical protein
MLYFSKTKNIIAMLFRSYKTIESKKNIDILKKTFLGQHLKVHNLDFEISEKDDKIKIIPHAENDDHIFTLPITSLKMIPKGDGTTIKLLCKPRRIDIGGPYLLMIFITFAIIAGILLIIKGEGNYNFTAYLLMGIAGITYIFLFIRMQQGYFDYIRKIKKWVVDHA